MLIIVLLILPLYVCSEHIRELTSINPRNVEQRHKEQFSKWFKSQVSGLMYTNVHVSISKICNQLIVIVIV